MTAREARGLVLWRRDQEGREGRRSSDGGLLRRVAGRVQDWGLRVVVLRGTYIGSGIERLQNFGSGQYWLEYMPRPVQVYPLYPNPDQAPMIARNEDVGHEFSAATKWRMYSDKII